MNLEIFRLLRGQRFHSGDVREEIYGGRNRQLVPKIALMN